MDSHCPLQAPEKSSADFSKSLCTLVDLCIKWKMFPLLYHNFVINSTHYVEIAHLSKKVEIR